MWLGSGNLFAPIFPNSSSEPCRCFALVSSRKNFASLFSGCGGFDLGFVQDGFECVAAYDVDPVAIRVYQNNLGHAISHQDLNQNSQAISLPSADVLIAGPPCQGFSTAGLRDPGDPRNKLLIRTADLAVAAAPKVVVIENVTGVVSGVQRRCWEAVESRLRSVGYRTVDIRCNANEMGVAQLRNRQLLIAWRTGYEGCIDLGTWKTETLREALAGVETAENHEPKWLEPNSDAARIARYIKPRQKLCNVRSGKRAVHTWEIPEVFGKTNRFERTVLKTLLRLRRRNRLRDFGDADPVTAHQLYCELNRPVAECLHRLVRKGYVRMIGARYDLSHTFNGKFRRLSWDHPASTVDTRFGDPRYFLHPDQDRGFSVREAARIQGFPDTFVFDGSVRDQFRLVGNAVPPPVARLVARFIRKHLLS